MIKVDVIKLAVQCCNIASNSIKALQRALIVGFKDLSVTINADSLTNKKLANLRGITLILEHYLNDLFDSSTRGILVTTNNKVVVKFTTLAANVPVKFKSSTGVGVRFGKIGANTSSYDFTVLVPNGILNAEKEKQIKIVTNKYKVAGYKAKFIYVNGIEF